MIDKKERKKEDKIFQTELAKRDNHCLCCGSFGNLTGHHVIPRRYNESRHDIRNGMSLCIDCHKKMHDNPDICETIWIHYATNVFQYFSSADEWYKYKQEIKS